MTPLAEVGIVMFSIAIVVSLVMASVFLWLIGEFVPRLAVVLLWLGLAGALLMSIGSGQ